jgi:helix-turn-helix protein
MAADRARRRAPRFASDSAHAWARNLRLGNVQAKLILSMLALYVDGEGMAFVGIPSLAEDCELSADTVRRRLAWLEEIGAISRHPQWIDEYGRRNGDARGKRTSDLIKLLYENDTDLIEQRAAGVAPETPVVSTAISPSWQQGLNQGENPVSPSAALGQPSHCGEGLISEPEPESSPLPPSRGASETISDQEEPEHFGPAWAAWPGHEVMRRDLALAEFRKLAPDKQALCRAAIPHFLAMQRRLKRDHRPNFHVWIRHGGFEEFPTAVLDEGPSASQGSGSYAVDSVEGRALKALCSLARKSLFERNGRLLYPLPITARVLAFAEAPPQSAWHWVDDRAQLAAWSAFLSASIHGHRPEILTTRGTGAEQRRGFYAPWPWPPRKDGTISASPEAGENE